MDGVLYSVGTVETVELDLQSLFGLLCTPVLLAESLRPRYSLPRIWAHIRGRYGQLR
jgi:hypothetical protein